MATSAKTYLDLTGLQKYDELIKNYIDTEDAKSIKTVLLDGDNIKFYKKANATTSDTADFTIPIASSDVTALKTRVGISTNLNSYESATDITNILNILTGDSSTTGSVAKAAADAVTTAESYTDDAIANLDADVDASGTAQHSGTFVVSGITEVDGVITGVDSVEVEAAGAAAALDATLATVAKSGEASDVTTTAITDGAPVNPETLYVAGNVQGTLQSIARDLNNLEAGSVVTISKSTDVSGLAARYTFSQGGTAIGTTVDIPADMVVSEGIVVDVVFNSTDNTLHEGSASGTDVTTEIKGTETATLSDAGKYIKLTIANSNASHLWIKATDLVDVYTAEQNATQVQLAINNNVISGAIVAGSIDTTELKNDAVTTLKIADDAVTADKVSIAAHAESADQTGRTDGLSITVTTTDGQVSGVAGAIAPNTYDAYGTATAAVAALDVSTAIPFASYAAGSSGSADVITINGGIKETDGVIEAGGGDTITLSTITNTQIDALFS